MLTRTALAPLATAPIAAQTHSLLQRTTPVPVAASGFLTGLSHLPATLRGTVPALFRSMKQGLSRPAMATPLLLSATVLSGCTETEQNVASGAWLGFTLAALAALAGNELAIAASKKRRGSQRKEENSGYERIAAERINEITSHFNGTKVLPDQEFLDLLTQDIDTTSGWANAFDFDSYRLEVLEEAAKQFDLIFSQGAASENIKDLFTKVFVEPKVWRGKSPFFLEALDKAIPHDPAFVVDCLLNLNIAKNQPAWQSRILEKIIPRIAHVLVTYPGKLTEAQKESAEIVIKGWEPVNTPDPERA